MELEELRKRCRQFFWCESIEDCQKLLDIYIEFFLGAVINHHNEEVKTQAEADAKMIIQMMMTKTLHLKKTLDGIGHQFKNGKVLNNIIDPTIVATQIRNIYETAGTFNLIYRSPKNKDEHEILYLLWVHAGLSYRRRFDEVITKDENKQKAEEEKKQMDRIKERIENNALYLKLDEANRKKIETKIRKKDYMMRFHGTNIEFLSFAQLIIPMDIKKGKLDTVYTYFSLYAHPSNVSVFQYADMFKKGEESYRELVHYNMQVAFMLLSVFIADYIHLFPSVLLSYENMSLVEQIVINFHNTQARSHSYNINDSWKATG